MADIIEMPKLSDTMTVGTLVKWLRAEGDAIKAGDMLAEVETDKATMELESFFTGTLIRIFAQPGSQVAIGAPLCAIGKPGETVTAPLPAVAQQTAGQTPGGQQPATVQATQKTEAREQKTEAKPMPVASTPTPPPVTPVASTPAAVASAPSSVLSPLSSDGPAGRIKISPLARKIAADQKIDASRLTGSGPHGRIVKADVLAAAANPALLKPASGSSTLSSQPSTFAGGTPAKTGPIQADRTVPVSTMRGVIAKRMVESTTTIPYIYLDIEIDTEPLLAIRAQLNTGLEKEGVKLSVNDFVLKAAAEALRRVPAVNSSWEGTAIRYHGAAHVAFAVALEDGLITPVVRDCHLKSVFQISAEAKALGKKAKDKKLAPNDYTGGTFCVSNLGMMGIPKFTAIINPPNSAILAVGATVAKPVVKNGAIVPGQMMTVTLSCDHRVFDGAVGAQWLGALKDLLEKPALLLV
ncbi:MAG: pyruvate dehydrogenase complex dihydrolipoamide acetyltransferase [Opitutae bacterium]|nr:pyruvate dehydrogenase complex dihydrolipoamide acetyltransferase [Opitutae bacterium]